MLKNRLVIIFVLLIYSCAYCQSNQNNGDSHMHSRMGEEGVFIHYNASLLFAGEYLYYSIYCLNKRTGVASDISKMAYVELVGDGGTVVFRQKIALEDGSGQGDFFIPVSVPSGNYKLIGYTQWMLNWGEESFFQGDVSILNPYTNAQSPFLSEENAGILTSDTLQASSKEKSRSNPVAMESRNILELSLDRDTLSKREKVRMVLRSLEGESGRFSISVRKYDGLYPLERSNSHHLKNRLDQTPEGSLSGKNILPEMRGELYSGTIATDAPNLPLDNQKVLFSTPGREYGLRVLTTDQEGNFSFSLNKEYMGDTAFFQVLGNDREHYSIRLNQKVYPDYGYFSFKKFRLNPEMEKMIIERSVHNQIENAYFSAKPDTIAVSKRTIPFYGSDAVVYDLDDYTRFSTLKETLVEIVLDIGIAKDRSGRSILFLRSKNSPSYKIGYQPLVIVDGSILQDFEGFIQYDARKIKTISIKKDPYIIGGHIFQGIIDVETLNGDYQMQSAPYIKEIAMLKPLENKKYFKQVYTQNKGLENIPDYRHQLLWLPSIELGAAEESVELFTSDVPGSYEISVEGFTVSGKPVSIRKQFEVN